MVAELRVAISPGIITLVLLPEQLFVHSNSAKFFDEVVQIGLKMIKTLVFVSRVSRMELTFQNRVIQGQLGLDIQRRSS